MLLGELNKKGERDLLIARVFKEADIKNKRLAPTGKPLILFGSRAKCQSAKPSASGSSRNLGRLYADLRLGEGIL